MRAVTRGLFLFTYWSLYCSRVLHSLPPISIFPDKVNRGHPSSVKNKHQNMSPGSFLPSLSLFLLVFPSDLLQIHSLSVLYRLSLLIYLKFLGWVAWQWYTTYASGSSEKSEGESPGDVYLTLWWLSHPEGWQQPSLCVCVWVQSVEQMAAVLVQRAAGLSLCVTGMTGAGSLQALVNTFLYRRLVKRVWAKLKWLFTKEQYSLSMFSALALRVACKYLLERKA